MFRCLIFLGGGIYWNALQLVELTRGFRFAWLILFALHFVTCPAFVMRSVKRPQGNWVVFSLDSQGRWFLVVTMIRKVR